MGRKLFKSTRHKKLKAVDPFYVGDRKLLLDKGLVYANQAPKPDDLDAEHIPNKLKEYMRWKEEYAEKRKALSKKVKNKKKLEKTLTRELFEKKPDDRGAEQPDVPEAKFVKMKHESEAAFLNRIEKHSETIINKSKYENQFDVRLETQGDKVIVKKDKKMSDRKRKQLNKLKDKLKMKKLNKKLEAENSNKKLKDYVKFGEIVHEPPQLTAFPRLPKSSKSGEKTPTIKPNSNNSGISEKDREMVIQRYRIMKQHGKFK